MGLSFIMHLKCRVNVKAQAALASNRCSWQYSIFCYRNASDGSVLSGCPDRFTIVHLISSRTTTTNTKRKIMCRTSAPRGRGYKAHTAKWES